jgi:hypothetical protein
MPSWSWRSPLPTALSTSGPHKQQVGPYTKYIRGDTMAVGRPVAHSSNSHTSVGQRSGGVPF